MKKDILRKNLGKYHNKESDTILLRTIRGTPRSTEGGEWIEIDVDSLEAITEDINFDPIGSGYGKYLEKWHAEGLITTKEKVTGKT